MSSLLALRREGQAVWLDYIRRDLLTDGSLARMVRDDGLSGVTSNPAIFAGAIAGSDLYDEQLRDLIAAEPGIDTQRLYEAVAIADIRMAADILRSVFEETDGVDGYVSLEVRPSLADSSAGTAQEARRLWHEVDRPNLMIKVPATAAGIEAFETLIAEGINVNVTLMFSMRHYEDVARAYIRGVDRCAAPGRVASVASFFVSRVDSKIDPILAVLDSPAAVALSGRVAVANSKLVYRRFQDLFDGAAFAAARQKGAHPQRVLWASTSTKNASYSDVLYVEELIGPLTVNTLPPKTLDAFRDHGKVRRSIDRDVDAAENVLRDLARVGVDLADATEQLQCEGVEKFAAPFDRLLESLDAKRPELAAGAAV